MYTYLIVDFKKKLGYSSDELKFTSGGGMDFYDWLTIFFLALIFGRLFFSEPKEKTLIITAFIFSLLLVLESSNRVLGYPYKKFDIAEILITVIQGGLGIGIILQLKNQNLINKAIWVLVLGINIYFPVVTIPGTWLRHYLTLHSTNAIITKWRPNAVITKVANNRIFVLQELKDKNGQTFVKAVSYYWNKKDSPRAETEADLLPGGGSMGSQHMNQPYALLVHIQSKLKGY